MHVRPTRQDNLNHIPAKKYCAFVTIIDYNDIAKIANDVLMAKYRTT